MHQLVIANLKNWFSLSKIYIYGELNSKNFCIIMFLFKLYTLDALHPIKA